MPTSVAVSLAGHAAFLAAFLGLVHTDPKEAARVVEGVDLLIAPSRPKPQPGVVKPQLSTMDFLKMALPSAPPRRAELAAVDVKTPDRKLKLADAPKLEDSSRKATAKLDALDLSRERSVKAASLTAEPISRRQAAATLASMPKLEDVGRRRVRNLPEAIALEDKRREATAILGGALDTAKPVSRRAAVQAAAALTEAENAPAPAARKGLDILPDAISLRERPEAVAAPKLDKMAEAPRLERRAAAAAAEGGPKKGIDIEGPLADRKVVASAVPAFPDWARSQGILEAEVAIRFNVDADGSVMPGMRVERTSGYGRLDKLCMDSLRNWKFAPAPGSGAQWGVITFRFVLE